MILVISSRELGIGSMRGTLQKPLNLNYGCISGAKETTEGNG